MQMLEGLKHCSEMQIDQALKNFLKLETGRKEGYIFKRVDVLLYAAISYFYLEEY